MPSVDAGIVLATFVAAADRVGLGSCPISAIRNHAAEVSDILGLPDHVFPVAGLGVGWPSFDGVMSPRLGLDVTVHHDRYDETALREKVAAYDQRRDAVQPYDPALRRKIRRGRRTMAGRRTRPGNIRCRSAPISAHSCARKGFKLD